MAFKVQVLDDRDRPTGEKLKRTVANLMVRRLLADWIVPNVSIRRRKVNQINLAELPRQTVVRRRYHPHEYQHHIEPKIEPLTWQNSEWQRYLEGY